MASEGCSVSLDGQLSDGLPGAMGILSRGDSHLSLSDLAAQGRLLGIGVDGGSANLADTLIAGNSVGLPLDFGAHVSFDGGNTIPIVICDGSELTRGEVSCPAPLEGVARTSTSLLAAQSPALSDVLGRGPIDFVP